MQTQLLVFFVVTQVSVLVFLGLVVWSASFTPGRSRIYRNGRRPHSEFQSYQPHYWAGVSRVGGFQPKFSIAKKGTHSAGLPQLLSHIKAHGKCPPERSRCLEELVYIDDTRLRNYPISDTDAGHCPPSLLNGRGKAIKAGNERRLVSPANNRTAYDHQAFKRSQNDMPEATNLVSRQTNRTTHHYNKNLFQKHFSQTLKNRRNIYHNWDLFQKDFAEMLENFRVYVYPDVVDTGSPFSKVFNPHNNPLDPTIGNFFSEHMFKLNLLNSTFYTTFPEKANLFFLPFSVNVLRNDPRVKTEESIADFVAHYVENVASRFDFWNRTQGADHFYVCCHSVGRIAASKITSLQRNSLQVVCSSNNYHKYYVPHKDVAMPQIWPRIQRSTATPPSERTRLAFYAGTVRNSRLRQHLVRLWKNDSDLDIYPGKIHGYAEAFQKTKFCLHVKGYEVNTARISDAIHFGCVPVIISDQYDLPFANVLDWKKLSIIISYVDIPALKKILLSVTKEQYRELYENICQVREHFQWHAKPSGYDSFHMTMYQLWLKRGLVRPPLMQ